MSKIKADGPDLLALAGLILLGIAMWFIADWPGLTAYAGTLCIVGAVAWGQRNGRAD